MAIRHYNIPLFIPELACPFRCVFCNQYSITGKIKAPSKEDVIDTIESHLKTFTPGTKRVEVAFFGGSFTGLTLEDQNFYLDLVQPYMATGLVQGIRISTRPDYIDVNNLENLKNKGVTAIELGAQSLDDEVLLLSGRGHTVADVERSITLIRSAGFEPGLQMMIGLPGDTAAKSMSTARQIVDLQALTTRIYPTLVIKDTRLETLYRNGEYIPISLDDAVALSADIYQIFEQAGVKVLRTGLHPSEGFYDGKTLVAGPFHSAFGELVLSRLWANRFEHDPAIKTGKAVVITVHPTSINAAIGHKAANRIWLERHCSKVRFVSSLSMEKGMYHVDFS